MAWFLSQKRQMCGQSALLRRFLTLVLLAFLIFSVTGARISTAGEGPIAEPVPAATPVPSEAFAPLAEFAPPEEPVPPEEFALPEESEEEPEPPGTTLKEKMAVLEKSMDDAHENLQKDFLDRVIRLDNFFGNVKTESRRKTEYQFRFRNAVRIESDGNYKIGPSIRANVVLSKINERLRLTVSGDNEPLPVTPSLPEDPGNPGFDRTTGNTRLVNTELRYGLIQTPSTELFLGAGVRLTLPPQAFARGRYQHTYHLSDVSLARFGETLFVRNPDGPGSTTAFDLERMLDQKTVLRWSTTGTVSYGLQGLEWGSELSWIRELSSTSAVTVMGGVYGNTSFDDVMGNYRLLTRYRRNFLRSWLFFEVEPELYWPRLGDGDFPTHFAFAFRLEVVFQGTAADKEKKSDLF